MNDSPRPLYQRPQTLETCLHLLSDGTWTIIAGCTLYYVDWRSRPLTDRLLDITAIAELKDITIDAVQVRLGALATWSDIARATLPAECSPLQQAARRIGARQIQNVGTLGGNVCGAAANADGIPPLLIADAEVELCAADRMRTLPLATFLRGSRQTGREADELLTAILIPRRYFHHTGIYIKLSRRAYQGLAIVSVAARIGTDHSGRIATTGVAVGGCSAVAQRLPALEMRLVEQAIDSGLPDLFDAETDLARLTPMTDAMASADYRADAAATLVRRSLQALQRTRR